MGWRYEAPFDSLAGWDCGDEAVTTRDLVYGDTSIPAGSTVKISSIPRGRDAGLYDLGAIEWEGEHYEASLSVETAGHHFGENTPDVRRP